MSNMSNNAAEPKIDVVQLTQSIRERIGRTSGAPSAQIERGAERPVAAEVLENLRSIDRDLDSFSSQLESGEPLLAARSLRGRIAAGLKYRLYRLLWWQSDQIKSLVALIARRGREEKAAIQALSDRAGQQSKEIRRLHQSLLDCKRQLRESESRLRHLESAQLRLQAADIERNVKSLAQWETALASLRHDMGEELARRAQAIAVQHDEIAARVSDLGLHAHQARTALSLQDRRLTAFLEEARKRLPEPFTTGQLGQIAKQHDEHRYDPLYLEFENLFRGSREEIKARQSVYLPLLKESGIGVEAMPILDLGCGRGEWLELLRDHNLHALGVDRNEAMIECSQGAELEVTQSDALSYLRSLADSSLGCITSFHMVEHLPFEITLALVDEALRVLKSGGILILETPNPQNILVASQNFYTDPTHLKPLPSPMLRFFVEARGFCGVQVWDLHPYPEAVRFPDDGRGMANRLNDYLYGPQDYAVIGRKP
ncbi:MAG: methyltransferase domain-containing protein [Terriglobia bacterium]